MRHAVNVKSKKFRCHIILSVRFDAMDLNRRNLPMSFRYRVNQNEEDNLYYSMDAMTIDGLLNT